MKINIIIMLLLVNFNAKGQEIKNKPIKPARKVALLKDKSVLPVLQLKSNNRFKKELLNAPLKPKTFTLSTLLLESKSKKQSIQVLIIGFHL